MSDVIEQLERVNKQMFNRVAIYNNMRPISPNQFELSGIVHKLIEEDWVPLVTAAISELKQLRADVADNNKSNTVRLLDDWHEDIGNVLWWKFPIVEPPYVGSPLSEDWPEYHTHFTLIPFPLAALEAEKKGE